MTTAPPLPYETNKGGRPSGYSDDIAATICTRLTDGESLRSVCRDDDMPSQSMVFRWLATNDGFREQYARACETRADVFAEEIVDISDDSSNDTIFDPESGNERMNAEFVARSRLRVDTRKWLMARMAPKKYGDKVTQEIQGTGGGPLVVEIVRLAAEAHGPHSTA